MSWITLSHKKVKIRKEHQCLGCMEVSKVGEQMYKVASVDGGDFSSTYWCTICEEFLADKWKDMDEGIGPGDCWEWPEYKQYREDKTERTMRFRYTISELEKKDSSDYMTDKALIIAVLNERMGDCTNVYSPLYKRLRATRDRIEKLDIQELNQ